MEPLHVVINPLHINGDIWVVENFIQETSDASETNGPKMRIYASAVVGRTLTNTVLVSRDFTDESGDNS